MALVEYVGAFPTYAEAHGNCLAGHSEYVYTEAEVLSPVDEQRPRQVYQDICQQKPDSDPKNVEQVYNRKKGVALASGTGAKANLPSR